MGSASPSVYASSSGRYVYATVTWDSDLRVTVNVNSNGSWRLVKRGSSSTVYLSCTYADSSYSDTFTATEGGEYIFQVYCTVEESYYNDSFGTSGFTVESDSGGGSSSGGGETEYCIINITKGVGVATLSVYRGWSQSETLQNQYLVDGLIIYQDDELTIDATAKDGYELDYYPYNDLEDKFDEELTFPFKLVNVVKNLSGKFRILESADASISATASLIPYTLSINAGLGINISIYRNKSPIAGASIGYISAGDTIYYSDELIITCSPSTGYEISTCTVNSQDWISGDTYTVSSDVEIAATADRQGLVYIGNGSEFQPYLIYIGNGSTWDQYVPYIGNGSTWDLYS